MNTKITQNPNINLTASSRAARLVVGTSLIAVVMSAHGALGLLAVLPLIAIYPIFTGAIGFDPLREICRGQRVSDCLLHLPRAARIASGAIGILMLGSVFMVSGAPGWLILLPLMAVYPVFLAVFGEEPVTALYNIDTSIYSTKTVVTSTTSVESNTAEQAKPVEITTQVKDHHPLAA